MSAARVIGVGSPIVDRLALVDETFLATAGGHKGGMQLVDTDCMENLLKQLPGKTQIAPGGSAANTLFALARLKMSAALLGKLGDDEEGRYYRRSFEQLGGDGSRLKTCAVSATARCLSMVTPDSERTMRTDLGAAAAFAPDDLCADDFRDCRHAHVEGYLLFNPDLALAVLDAAKSAGCTISLDLGAFEVVNGAVQILPQLLDRYVDVVLANEDEAAAFCGRRDPLAGLDALSGHCAMAVVKCGAEGALIREKGKTYEVPAHYVDHVKDTTGAGDFWAAGFLYGLMNDCEMDACGHLGALLGATVVRHLGADLPSEAWDSIREDFKHYLHLQER